MPVVGTIRLAQRVSPRSPAIVCPSRSSISSSASSMTLVPPSSNIKNPSPVPLPSIRFLVSRCELLSFFRDVDRGPRQPKILLSTSQGNDSVCFFVTWLHLISFQWGAFEKRETVSTGTSSLCSIPSRENSTKTESIVREHPRLPGR
jgi:hypothetical protein